MTLRIDDREFASQAAFAAEGRRCGTPVLNDFQKARIRSHRRTLELANADPTSVGPIDIPVLFHIIHDGLRGQLSDADIQNQLDVMNAAFSVHGITFSNAGIDRTDNATLYRMTMGSAAERQAKTALGRQQDTHLNFYTAGIGGSLLGWATFPSELAGDPVRDGVVILTSSLPGGASPPYDQGKTAVHEIGHWLGLYHTFEGGCTPPGDEVDDTPFEATENVGPADPNRDTCPQPGKDPTTNYMDYTDDAGMVEFTPGQDHRMKEQVMLYRPLLAGAGVVASMVGSGLNINLVTGEF